MIFGRNFNQMTGEREDPYSSLTPLAIGAAAVTLAVGIGSANKVDHAPVSHDPEQESPIVIEQAEGPGYGEGTDFVFMSDDDVRDTIQRSELGSAIKEAVGDMGSVESSLVEGESSEQMIYPLGVDPEDNNGN